MGHFGPACSISQVLLSYNAVLPLPMVCETDLQMTGQIQILLVKHIRQDELQQVLKLAQIVLQWCASEHDAPLTLLCNPAHVSASLGLRVEACETRSEGTLC